MDFSFSEEQEMLRQQARAFLADKFPPERVAQLAESEDGWDGATWREIAGLGWTGLSVPEDHGGAGMSFLDEAVLFEELGFALYPGPYFATVGLALPALDRGRAARVASGDAAATIAWAEPGGPLLLSEAAACSCKAEESGGEWRLTGTKHLVPDLAAATIVVVAAQSADGLGLWAVEGVAGSTLATVDTTRRYGRLELDGAPGELIVAPGEAEAVLARIRERALVACALEAVGVAQKALDLAREHASGREQFGKPIGVYQAVSHQIADIYADVELARSTAYWAAWCVAEDEDRAPVAAPAAKALASSAAVAACERSIQVHGGIGFTWEHILHRYYKRAQWIESFEGHASAHRAAIAASLLD